MKQCSSCKQVLSIKNFCRNQRRCKECHNLYMRKWRKLNKPILNNINKLKDLARHKLGVYLRRGKIIKDENCFQCGSDINIEAHHHDYTKALEVLWLCRRCHTELHRKWNITLEEVVENNVIKL